MDLPVPCEELYLDALSILEELLEKDLKNMPYQALAICFNRIAICRYLLNNNTYISLQNQIENLLTIYQDENLSKLVSNEFIRYTNQISK